MTPPGEHDHRPQQRSLFGGSSAVPEPPVVLPAPPSEAILRVASRVPKNAHLGTSSWSFPGWEGLVNSGIHTSATLARYGLSAYARHPLLRSVSLDSAFYRPATSEQFSRYAAQVPDDFRFIVKAYGGLTTSPESARGTRLADSEAHFLDAGFASRQVIAPIVAGLGSKLGVILFQFSPLGPLYTRSPALFAQRLEAFLGELPVGPTYAVELRDPQVLGPRYESALAATGAVHCLSVHSRMPPPDEQVGIRTEGGPMVIRWMLRPGDDYEAAGARFAPFDRLREPDELNRGRVVRLIRNGLSSGCDVHVAAANNAEGCAPQTLMELAKSLTGP
jgi:uncharacterized protein YecE (DUF72 family)